MQPLSFAVATAALSVEGDDAADDPTPRADTVWDVFAAAGRTADGTGPRSAPAIGLDPQLDAARRIGVQEFRFGINWARVRPDGVHTLPAALDRYERQVDAVLAAGMDPVLTLHHGDLPLELMLGGGWLERDTSALFAEYAADVAERFGDRVERWVTLVDPFGTAFHGYGFGVDAPGLVLLGGAFAALHHVLLGHGSAVEAVRSAAGRTVRLGLLADHTAVEPATPAEPDVAAAAWYDTFHNGLVAGAVLAGEYPAAFEHLAGTALDVVAPEDPRVISAPVDFHGVRFEFGRTVAAAPDNTSVPFTMVDGPSEAQGSGHRTSTGWPVRADHLHRCLVLLRHRYPSLPPLRVEVGAAFDGPDADARRVDHLEEHLAAVERAVAQGVPIESFGHGHLVDGWEFADGLTRPSGLLAVDPTADGPVAREVLQHYRDLIERRRTAPDDPEKGPTGDAVSEPDGRMGP